MTGAPPGVFRIGWIRRGTREFVEEHLAAAPGCESCPGPHVPAESQIAMERGRGGTCRRIGCTRFRPDQPDKQTRETLGETLLEVVDRDRVARNEHLSFVGV